MTPRELDALIYQHLKANNQLQSDEDTLKSKIIGPAALNRFQNVKGFTTKKD